MHVQSPYSLALSELPIALDRLRPMVENHITPERMRRYVTAIADTPAPSTAASVLRAPVLYDLLKQDGALQAGLTLDANFANTASTVILTGAPEPQKPLWYFAHLDTISYLVRPQQDGRYPLVPFCYHLTKTGTREARCYRFDPASGSYGIVTKGQLLSEAGAPFFQPDPAAPMLRPGDRIVPITPAKPAANGHWTGHFDNAGGVAALAVAAPVLAAAGLEAMLAFPDEEEGPAGAGNQVSGRGGSRLIDRLSPPDLAIIVDMQQAGRDADDALGVRLGQGAVLSEFSSLARGAVTPPHLLALVRELAERLGGRYGVNVQEAFNGYTSRSDDISVMLKTPNIVLLGFPGLDRHFDTGLPMANLDDLIDLSKALVYAALLRPAIRAFMNGFGEAR